MPHLIRSDGKQVYVTDSQLDELRSRGLEIPTEPVLAGLRRSICCWRFLGSVLALPLAMVLTTFLCAEVFNRNCGDFVETSSICGPFYVRGHGETEDAARTAAQRELEELAPFVNLRLMEFDITSSQVVQESWDGELYEATVYYRTSNLRQPLEPQLNAIRNRVVDPGLVTEYWQTYPYFGQPDLSKTQ